MTVLHVGAVHSPRVIDGVNATAWQAAAEQARLGENVTLLLDRAPDTHAELVAHETGLKLTHVPATGLRFDAAGLDAALDGVDLVHMHSVFVPRQATLARTLVRRGIPYVITPNGGLSPDVLRRGRVKKWTYSLLAERPRFAGAAAVSVVVPGEEADVRAFVPDYKGALEWVPNPVDRTDLASAHWQYRKDTPKVLFLGRFEVLHKGLDLFWDIAARMPGVQFDLHGKVDPRTAKEFDTLKARNLPNVRVLPPVYGADKAEVMAGATLYLQTSRWEGFPLSIAEAMFVGLPVAITERTNVGQQFRGQDLGLTLPANADAAAGMIENALRTPSRLENWSLRGKAFALKHMTAPAVARRFLDLYSNVLDGRPPAVRDAALPQTVGA